MHYYGDFYILLGEPNRCCRSTLEIVTEPPRDNEWYRLLTSPPDVVVVMTNPGGSAPTNGDNGTERAPSDIGRDVNLVETVRDQTQAQIEAIMERKRYEHVRVLNLSDVRETSLSELGKSLNCQALGDSVFACQARKDELRARLNPRLGIVVAAWSYETAGAITKRGKAAYDAILNSGYKLVGSGGRFAHPSRAGDAWVEDLTGKLPIRNRS